MTCYNCCHWTISTSNQHIAINTCSNDESEWSGMLKWFNDSCGQFSREKIRYEEGNDESR